MEENKIYDTSAVIELLASRKLKFIPGAITIFTAIEYPPVIPKVSTIIYPSKKDYILAIKWQAKLRKYGRPLPAVDLLIAAIAFNNGFTLVTLDKHFEVIRELEPRLNIVFKLL